MIRHRAGAQSPVIDRTLRLAERQRALGHGQEAALLYRQVCDADAGNAEATQGNAELVDGRSLARRAVGRATRESLERVTRRSRLWKYQVLSTCHRRSGSPIMLQPVLFLGPGAVVLGEDVQFGWPASPSFHTGYCHVEVSSPESLIEVGDRTEFNNNLLMKSEGAGIRIGPDGLFGAAVEIFDSNFHDLDPGRRRSPTQRMAPVQIGANVFVGMGVRILKGVTIGEDSVIGAGAVVASSIPPGVIAVGNPARVLREL